MELFNENDHGCQEVVALREYDNEGGVIAEHFPDRGSTMAELGADFNLSLEFSTFISGLEGLTLRANDVYQSLLALGKYEEVNKVRDVWDVLNTLLYTFDHLRSMGDGGLIEAPSDKVRDSITGLQKEYGAPLSSEEFVKLADVALETLRTHALGMRELLAKVGRETMH